MKEKIKKLIFITYFLLIRPIRIFNKNLENLIRPRVLLNFCIFLTLFFLFLKNINAFLMNLKPKITSEVIMFAFLTLCCYVWKYADSNNGETWKQDYNKAKINPNNWFEKWVFK
jgi:hypothetical protein